jgi:hypothetical protein
MGRHLENENCRLAATVQLRGLFPEKGMPSPLRTVRDEKLLSGPMGVKGIDRTDGAECFRSALEGCFGKEKRPMLLKGQIMAESKTTVPWIAPAWPLTFRVDSF